MKCVINSFVEVFIPLHKFIQLNVKFVRWVIFPLRGDPAGLGDHNEIICLGGVTSCFFPGNPICIL